MQIGINDSSEMPTCWINARIRIEEALSSTLLLDSTLSPEKKLLGYSLIYQAVLNEEVPSSDKSILELVRMGLRLKPASGAVAPILAESLIHGSYLWLTEAPTNDSPLAAATVYVSLSSKANEAKFHDWLGTRAETLLIPDILVHEGYAIGRKFEKLRTDKIYLDKTYSVVVSDLAKTTGILLNKEHRDREIDKVLDSVAALYDKVVEIVPQIDEEQIQSEGHLYNFKLWATNTCFSLKFFDKNEIRSHELQLVQNIVIDAKNWRNIWYRFAFM